MRIILSNSDKRPLYEQITSQIKREIFSGGLKAGDALPSMRLLAKELRISVITTKRVYEDLERDGFIETVAGKGSFVAKLSFKRITEEKRKSVINHLNAAAKEAASCGMSKKELHDILDMQLKNKEAMQ